MATAGHPATRLVTDVGGTNTRIALSDPGSADLRATTTYRNGDHSRFEDIIALWLDSLGEPAPKECCIAVAAPPADDLVSMVNIDWSFSCRALAQRFGFSRLGWINDFQANAYALPHLQDGERVALHPGQSPGGDKLATMGPGTGLGGATLEWVDGGPRARACEPGHMGLAPATTLELEIFSMLLPRGGEIHAERLVSGPGLQLLYELLAEVRGVRPQVGAPAEISDAALRGVDDLCTEALSTFCALLGSACGDFVLANGAYGGMYLAGGIVPRMLDFLAASSFARRFREKGAMGAHLAAVPLYAITAPHPGLIGAAHAPL